MDLWVMLLCAVCCLLELVNLMEVREMKIIAIDNYDRGNMNEVLVADKVSKIHGDVMTQALNKTFGGPDELLYYKLVEENYKLFEVDHGQ